MRPDYIYILREEDGDHSLVKIGHSVDPINRPAGYKAGNYRRLVVLLTLLGGQKLESEIHSRFQEYRIGTGGDEWFKLSPEMITFFQDKMKGLLLSDDTTLVFNKRVFGGPISIPTVELGVVETRAVSSVARVDSVQLHSVTEVEQPKSPYSKVGQRAK